MTLVNQSWAFPSIFRDCELLFSTRESDALFAPDDMPCRASGQESSIAFPLTAGHRLIDRKYFLSMVAFLWSIINSEKLCVRRVRSSDWVIFWMPQCHRCLWDSKHRFKLAATLPGNQNSQIPNPCLQWGPGLLTGAGSEICT